MKEKSLPTKVSLALEIIRALAGRADRPNTDEVAVYNAALKVVEAYLREPKP